MCEEYKKMIGNVLDAFVRRRTRLPANGLGDFEKAARWQHQTSF